MRNLVKKVRNFGIFLRFIAVWRGLLRRIGTKAEQITRKLLFCGTNQGCVFYAAFNNCHKYNSDREPAQVACCGKACKKIINTMKNYSRNKERNPGRLLTAAENKKTAESGTGHVNYIRSQNSYSNLAVEQGSAAAVCNLQVVKIINN